MKIEQEIGEILKKGLQKTMIALNRNASGKASKSIGIVVKPGRVLVVDTTEDGYWENIDKGRKAGKMPPFNKIRPWVNIKLKLKGKKADSVAWAIMKKIGKEGAPTRNSPARKTLGLVDRNYLALKPEIDRKIDEYIREELLTQIEL